MSILYIITNTIGVDQFTILPGALNGPEGPTANTDLRLYGQGATLYGEGVNENIYKLTESFACPEKVTGDFLVGTDVSAAYTPGTPGNGSYVTGTDPITPKDAEDFKLVGPNHGINNPLNGQPWFNTTTNKLMIFDSVGGFQHIGAPTVGLTPPTSPTEGDLWYDTNVPQLKVYDSVAVDFISVASKYLLLDGTVAMTGALNLNTIHKIINLAEPTANQDAATKFFVDALRTDVVSNGLLDSLYINATVDDLMDANLTMEGGKTITFGTNLFPTMVFGKGNGIPTVGANIEFEQASGLIAAGSDIRIHIDAISVGGVFVIAKDSGTYKIDGLQVDLFTIESNGRIKSNIDDYETLVNADDVIPNKKYVDDEIAAASATVGGIPIGGIVMYSGLFSAIPANYALCDGTSGTPNLTDKFVYGTNTEGQLEATGGTADSVVVTHTHTTDTEPNHTHSLGTVGSTSGGAVTDIFSGSPSTQAVTEQPAGTHSHSVLAPVGAVSGTGQNIPPYVKLAYIQRLS